MRQIELNVAIKQYEKVLTELLDARPQSELGMPQPGLSADQQEQWSINIQRKLKYLERTAAQLREQIHGYLAEANKEAVQLQQKKEDAKAKQPAAPGPTTAEPRG